MVIAAVTFALIGLGAVGSAAPTPTTVDEKRQFLGPPVGGGPGGGFTWGPTDPRPTCLVNVPIKDQPPCIPFVIGGPLRPPGHNKRFSLPSDWNKDVKATIAAIELKLEALQNKPHKSQDDKDQIADLKAALKYIAGITNISAPPGVGSVFIPGKMMAKRFSLPDGWNKDIKQTIATLELRLEALQNKSHKSQDDKDEIADLKAALKYIAGITNISAPPGVGSVFIPGKMAKRFSLPDGWNKDIKATIAKLELRLEALQNKSHKSQDDKDEIADIKAALKYIAGITNISAPPGVGSVFIPGKMMAKRFSLPDGWNKDIKATIAQLELRLEALQNKSHKSQDDKDEIADIKACLKYIAGITNISAPPGVGSVFIPGKTKRFTLPDGWNQNVKDTIAKLELRLEVLQNKSHKSQDDKDEIADIKACLKYIAGITNISAPPGVGSVFIPGKRQTFTIGDSMCKNAELLNYREVLAQLIREYGPPSQAPKNIQIIEQVIITTLRFCDKSWTGPMIPDPHNPGGPLIPDPAWPGSPITPDPTYPGAPITPDPTYPGAPINPDPVNPGAPIVPDPTVPGAPLVPSN